MSVDKGIKSVLELAFPESLQLVNLSGEPHLSFIQEDTIRRLWYRSAMSTISCGYFRILVMLHFPIRQNYPECFSHIFENPEFVKDRDKYLDMMNEVSNKLCGTSCNILEENHYSTGMTRPNLLTVSRAIDYVGSLNVIGSSHIGSYVNDKPFLMGSLFVDANRGEEGNVNIQISREENREIVNSGELELF